MQASVSDRRDYEHDDPVYRWHVFVLQSIELVWRPPGAAGRIAPP